MRLDNEAIEQIERASDVFLAQLGRDAAAYARHAGRKTVDASDMLQLLYRYCVRRMPCLMVQAALA